MANLTMHARHVAQDGYFKRSWPDLDTRRWPGRELYWCWRNPFLALLIFSTAFVVDAAAIVHIVERWT